MSSEATSDGTSVDSAELIKPGRVEEACFFTSADRVTGIAFLNKMRREALMRHVSLKFIPLVYPIFILMFLDLFRNQNEVNTSNTDRIRSTLLSTI